MRILQIIDSLEAGGAERMAVNYANALCKKVEFSGLIATRKEGNLKNQINQSVDYLFLNAIKKIDFKAIKKLYNYCKTNQITHIHAHSSSYQIAVIIKLFTPKINIIWHNHFGNNEFLKNRKLLFLKIGSSFFSKVIAVNQNLEYWSKTVLKHKNVIYLPNFASKNSIEIQETYLQGNQEKKILCLANLRIEKNHFMLIEVAKNVVAKHPDWSFHLVGKDFHDAYSQKLKTSIEKENLKENIFIYGTKTDTDFIISQASICILTSESEGLPVALIEYGMQKKPVVATAVGEIPNIIIHKKNGYLAPSNNVNLFSKYLLELIGNHNLQNKIGEAFFQTIFKDFSEEKVIDKYLKFIKS